jgi:hypothetical protein
MLARHIRRVVHHSALNNMAMVLLQVLGRVLGSFRNGQGSFCRSCWIFPLCKYFPYWLAVLLGISDIWLFVTAKNKEVRVGFRETEECLNQITHRILL